jgi:hypothetical protein
LFTVTRILNPFHANYCGRSHFSRPPLRNHEIFNQRLQSLPPHGHRGHPPHPLAAFQHHRRTPAESRHSRLQLHHDPLHLAQPPHRHAKLKIKEMGSRYLFLCLYVWLEKYFSRGDYMRNPRGSR